MIYSLYSTFTRQHSVQLGRSRVVAPALSQTPRGLFVRRGTSTTADDEMCVCVHAAANVDIICLIWGHHWPPFLSNITHTQAPYVFVAAISYYYYVLWSFSMVIRRLYLCTGSPVLVRTRWIPVWLVLSAIVLCVLQCERMIASLAINMSSLILVLLPVFSLFPPSEQTRRQLRHIGWWPPCTTHLKNKPNRINKKIKKKKKREFA